MTRAAAHRSAGFAAALAGAGLLAACSPSVSETAAVGPKVGVVTVPGVDHPVTAFLLGQTSEQHLPSGADVVIGMDDPHLVGLQPSATLSALTTSVSLAVRVAVTVESGPSVAVDPAQFSAIAATGPTSLVGELAGETGLAQLSSDSVGVGSPYVAALTLDVAPGAVRIYWTPPGGTRVSFDLTVETD